MRTKEFVLTYYDSKDTKYKSISFKTIPFTLSWNKEKKTISLNLHGSIGNLFKEGEVINQISIDITDDPTLDYSGGVVSLGYYILRIVIENSRFHLEKGLMVFSTRYVDGFSFRLSRPARRPLEFPEKKEGFSYTICPFVFSTKNESNLLTLLFNEDHSKEWKFVNTFVNNDYSLVGRLSPMSLFYPIEEMRRGKSVKDSAEVHHNKLIEEVLI